MPSPGVPGAGMRGAGMKVPGWGMVWRVVQGMAATSRL